MSGKLEGRVAIVTGAGRGIGLAAAAALAGAGAHVTLVSRSPAEIEAAAAEIRTGGGTADALALDVLDDKAVAAAIAGAGPLDVLFNCAGFVHQNSIETCTDDEWDFAFALNVRAMWQTTRAALPGMVAVVVGVGLVVRAGRPTTILEAAT